MQLEYISLAIVFSFVASSLTIPTSSVILIGEMAEMKCSVTGSGLTTWTYTSWNASTEREIYSGVDIFDWVKSRYKIDKNISGQHNLIIDSVDFAHAGRYKCTSGIQKTLRSDIQLIVLGCEPECDTNASLTDRRLSIIEHNYLWMWCRINYTSNMIPVFNMSKEKAQGDITDYALYANTTDYYTIPLTATAAVTTQLNSDDNGAKIKLRITFQLSSSYGVADLNLHSYTWNYTVNVLYGPKNVTIVRLEDRLLCTADGNPNPIYNWINFDANRSTDGPVHWLNYAMESNRTYIIQCETTNALGSERKNISICQHPGNTSIKATSAEPDNEDTSYSTLNVQPPTKDEASAYCELRLIEKSDTDFINQAREEKLSKSKSSKRNVSRGTRSAQLPTLRYQPNRQPSVPSEKFISTTLSSNKRKTSKTTTTSEDYCILTHPPSTTEDPQLYCELRLND